MKKTIILLIVMLLVGTFFTPITYASVTKNLSNKTDETLDNETEYWIVIVGIADYDGFGILFGNDLPVSNAHMRMIYDAFLSKDNFEEDHIKLLLNDDAKRNDILSALDWLASSSDSNDIIIFSYQGHGSSQPDDGSDEKDGMDEGLVPWEGAEELITDDELDVKFDSINCRGMFLMFHSCLSGGLISKQQGLSVSSTQKIRSFEQEFTSDVNGNNRVIVMSSMDQGVALAFPSLTRQIAVGIQSGLADKNRDKVITAEELAKYGKTLVNSLFLLIAIVFPPVIISFLMVNVISFIFYRYFCLPFPTIYDGYSGDLPIVYL